MKFPLRKKQKKVEASGGETLSRSSLCCRVKSAEGVQSVVSRHGRIITAISMFVYFQPTYVVVLFHKCSTKETAFLPMIQGARCASKQILTHLSAHSKGDRILRTDYVDSKKVIVSPNYARRRHTGLVFVAFFPVLGRSWETQR